MPDGKNGAKEKRRSKAAPTLPVVGAAALSFSLAGGASAATGGSAAEMPAQKGAANHEIALGEEEFSDVSLATFHVFDKENLKQLPPGVQLARRCGGCGGCRGCGCRGCGGCGVWWGCGCACCLSWGACRIC